MHLAAVLGPVYLLTGLSVLIYPDQWEKVVKSWEKEHLAVIGLSFFTLFLGSYIISIHNIWEMGITGLITLIGWIAFVKGIFYFLAPSKWIKEILKSWKNPRLIALSGLVAIALGAMLSYHGYLI